MYNIVYKITNNINGKVYIGAHSTHDLNDNYWGSGKLIRLAISKYGKSNFTKRVLKQFSNRDEMFKYEKQLVSVPFIESKRTYNLALGGNGSINYNCTGLVPVITTDGIKKHVSKEQFRNDPTLTFIPFLEGNIRVTDSAGIRKWVTREEYHASDELESVFKNTVVARKQDGSTIQVSKEEFDSNDTLVGVTSGQNNNESLYTIHNSAGDIKFTVENLNFISFCKAHDLPYGALTKSYAAGGTPIYQNTKSNTQRLINSGAIQYKGWYAINLKGKLNGPRNINKK